MLVGTKEPVKVVRDPDAAPLQGDVPKYLDRVIEIGEYATVVIHKGSKLVEGNNHHQRKRVISLQVGQHLRLRVRALSQLSVRENV